VHGPTDPATKISSPPASRASLTPARLIGAEGVRLDHLGPGLHVVAVDLEDEFGVREAQLVVAGIDEHPAVVDHRPHCAVEDERRLLHAREEVQGYSSSSNCDFAA
jgi:hypothetical protein